MAIFGLFSASFLPAQTRHPAAKHYVCPCPVETLNVSSAAEPS